MDPRHKLNRVTHDPDARTIYISLRPRSQRRPEDSFEPGGRVVLDLDAEGDLYGVRLVGVDPGRARSILERLKALPK